MKQILTDSVGLMKKKYGRIITNCYNLDIFDEKEIILKEETEGFVVYVIKDSEVHRLFYFAKDESVLRGVVDIAQKTDSVIEVVTRKPEAEREMLLQAGFREYASLLRFSCADCSKLNLYQEGDILPESCHVATNGEAADIYRKLHETFDKRISHLGTLQEIYKSIERGEFYISETKEGEVVTLLQLVKEPGKLYINQVINDREKGCIHPLLKKLISEYVLSGGKYLYSWIESDNVASLKFHMKYGMKHDGTTNLIFVG